jgi:hypothetical protein
LSDTTAILIVNDEQATIDSVRAVVESVDGHLVLHATPGVFIAQIPDDGVATVALNPNVAFITKSPFSPADHGITDLNATLAIGYFNRVGVLAEYPTAVLAAVAYCEAPSAEAWPTYAAARRRWLGDRESNPD